MKSTTMARAAIGGILWGVAAAITMPLTAEAYHGRGYYHGGYHHGGHYHGGFRDRFRSDRFRPDRPSRQAFHAPDQDLNRTPVNLELSRGHGPFATRLSPSFSQREYMHDASVHGYHRFGVFGWVGPVFWPYAFSDITCDVFWGYWGAGCADPSWSAAYGDPFWDYGYGDIHGGLFSPFTFNDLAPFLPNGPSSLRDARAAKGATAGPIAQMCGDDTRDIAGWPVDRIRDLVSPDDKQRAALDDFAGASVKAAQIVKEGCPSLVAFSPAGRLATMERRIEAMRQAVETVRRPLDALYDALTDEQKAKLSAAGEPPAPGTDGRQHGAEQSCSAAGAAAGTAANAAWPDARIEAVLHPDEAQLAKLKALQAAAAQAAEQLAASCPAETPATPSARLAAIAKRLNAMLAAVKTVGSALDGFYAVLSDEQKAQFDRIGQARTAERQG